MTTARRTSIPGQLARHAALAAGAVVILAPFFVMIRTALLPQHLLFSGHVGLGDLTLANFHTAVSQLDWVRLYRNSLIVTGAILLAQIATCLPAAYVLARHTYRGRTVLMGIVLACLVIPPQTTAVPAFVILARAHLLNSLLALILPFTTSAFGIFLFRQFIITIPQSIFDAARLDGVTKIGMLWHVVLPNVRPALLAFSIFIVTSAWNDLFWPSVVLQNPRDDTVPLGIGLFADPNAGSNYGAQMAAATLAIAPLVIAFLLAQRRFLRGIAITAGL